MRYAFAGDRDISVWVLEYLISQWSAPAALILPHSARATHAQALVELCKSADTRVIQKHLNDPLVGPELASLDLDLLLSIHYPHLIPGPILSLPRLGSFNLHPALLPFNRGWHTPTWAILDATPAGATLHYMTDALDAGDIVHQKEVAVEPSDSAHTLYEKLKRCELEVFKEAWPSLARGEIHRRPQIGPGTAHRKQELFRPEVQRISLDQTMTAGELLTRLRALTTNAWDEAAYFEVGGKKFRIQIAIRAD